MSCDASCFFLTAPLAYMPEAVLAAIVFLIGVDLIDLQGMRSIFEQRRSEFWVALITATMVVVVGVEQGILLAIALSLIDHTRYGYRSKNAVLVRSESGAWQPQPVTTAAQAAPGLLVYRFTHSLYYANSQQLSDEISFLVEAAQPPLRWLCFEASAVDDVDYSAAETLRSTYVRLKKKGVRLVVTDLMEDVGAESRYRLRELFGEDAFYDRLDDVLKAYRRSPAPLPRGARNTVSLPSDERRNVQRGPVESQLDLVGARGGHPLPHSGPKVASHNGACPLFGRKQAERVVLDKTTGGATRRPGCRGSVAFVVGRDIFCATEQPEVRVELVNTLIIGVDGGEPAIFEALARDGEAPSFSALRERGLTGRTCNPKGFEAGAVWPAFHTGLNPGRQPQYDGLRFFDPVTYTNRWFESHEIAPQIWRRASDQGKRVLVIDAPYARLDTEIDGAMIVDWGGHVPSDGQSFRFQTHPAALRSEVLEVVGPDPAGGVLCDRRKLESTGDYREFVRNYLDRIERKAQLAAHMFRKGPWDYAEVVFTELHCVGHHTWHVNDPTHPKYSRQLEVSLGRPLRDAYRAFDRALGRIVGAIDERTNLVLFVSHGMGPQYSGTGLLDRMLAGLESDGGSPRWREPRRPIKARLLTLWHAVPGELRAKLKPLRKPFAGALGVKQFLPNPQGRRFFEVYANNAVGGVRLNLAGRERAGCVSPDDYWKVLDALSEELRDFTNADSGDRLVEECIPTRKLYDGPFSGHLPDLLVVWNRSAPIREVVSPRTGRLRQDYAGARTGDHTPHGMFILAGPQVQPKVLDVDVAPVDFLPTVAALLGIEPGPTQGKSIDGIGR